MAPEQPENLPLLRRKTTRRALLATTATLAAAGATVAVVGATARNGGGSSQAATLPGSTPPAGQASAQPPAAAAPPVLIADPLRRAAHLLRRAGFGATMAEIETFAKLDRQEAAARLIDYERVDNSALDARLKAANFGLEYSDATPGRIVQDMQRWWLTRMAYTARPLEERMTYIWHGLLTSQLSKVGVLRARLLIRQNELLRANALARYDDLLQAISKDPAMLYYLDTVESTKERPNENYGRELMELFSMGVGNYSEDDVREAARAFTGWRLTQPARPNTAGLSQAEADALRRRLAATFDPEFRLQPALHDGGEKTLLGRTGPWGGEDVVRIIMEQPATGRRITRRLFTEFAHYNPSEEALAALVKTWDESGHSVREVVRAILTSDAFYSEEAYRGIVRSPVEFMVGVVRGLELETAFQGVPATARNMDQVLFEPPSVAGWPGGANWLSSGTFYARANFADSFLLGRQRATLPAAMTALDAPGVTDHVLARLVDSNVAPGARQAIADFAATVRDPRERAAAVVYLVLASPEYQLI